MKALPALHPMMKKYGLNKCFQFGVVGLLGWLVFSIFTVKTQAQQSNIVPDNTLGAESSRLNRNVVINGIDADSIDGGARRDINLFHSFSEFNINDGQTIYFVNPDGVENILTRVTGGNASNIFGTLGVDGAANLFLINPNGIVFGENASLDLQGSFVGTTASGLQFGEQGTFSATNPEAPGLLTVNPNALFFNQLQTAAMVANQSVLGVAPGKNLALIGGNVDLNASTLQAFGGNLELAAISGTGTVEINKNGNLNLPENLARANATISNSLIDVAANNGGSIAINANNLDISRSIIQAGIYYGLGTVDSQAGDITINTTGQLEIASQSFIQNLVFPGAIGKGGNIRINTDSISTNNINLISASTLGKGDAGSVAVKAKNDIALNGSDIYSVVGKDAEGNAGNIDITTRNFSLSNGAWLSASTLGKGNAGDVIVNAGDSVSVDGVSSNLRPSAIRSIIEENAEGKGGNIRINTGSLSITNSGKIDTSVFGKGDAGDVIINAKDTVSLDGLTQKLENSSSIFTSVEDDGIGNAGNINITANSLFLTNGGSLLSRTENQGNAGNITVQARDSVIVDGAALQNSEEDSFLYFLPSAIISSVEKDAKGNAGNILINAGNNISLNPDAKVVIGAIADGVNNNNDIDTESLTKSPFGVNIQATTNGEGNAGDITIKTGGGIFLDNKATIGSLVLKEGVGKGGNIKISTGSLSIAGAAQLDSSTFGEGDAGDVIVDARDNVLFTGGKPNANRSGILSTAEREGKGNSGNININADSVFVNDGARLSTFTTKKGNAGNITIQARNRVNIADEGEIGTQTAGEGNAGNISINAVNQLSLDKNSVISSAVAGNAKGNGGTISINAESLSMTSGSQLQTSTFGRGNAGDVTIHTSGDISLSELAQQKGEPISTGITSSVESSGIGDGGNIRINARNLSMKDNSTLRAITQGQGNSGNIFINTSNRVSLDSRAIISNIVGKVENPGELGDGKGGTIGINTGTLSMLNGSQVQASTFGKGDAGDIIINARDSFLASGFGEFDDLTRPTAVFSIVAPDSKGNGGNIRVNTGSLFVEDGARLSVSTVGQGKAGNINIDARDTTVVDGVSEVGFFSELSTVTRKGATGSGGKITINTDSFHVSNGGLINAQTFSAFRGGDVNINANTFTGVTGGQVNTATFGSGNAGNINLNIKDTITLSGTGEGFRSGLFASTSAESTGKGGSIFIDPRLVIIENGAGISVESNGSKDAGDIALQAGTLQLNNGFITAQTASTQGGNIDLQISDLLLLRNKSQITTTAGTALAGGDGGNIDINSKFIVSIPKENSDITANAFSGNGGRVNIISSGIFGIESQESLTGKSDITASSEEAISGETNINADDTSSIQNSFTELPPTIDTDAIIANSCIARGNKRQENSFRNTGSGGLRSDRPNNIFVSNYTTGKVRTVESRNQSWEKGDPIVEPQGLYRLKNGELLLSRECSG